MEYEKEREIVLYYLKNIADKPLTSKLKKYELDVFIEWVKSNFEDIFNNSTVPDTEKDTSTMEALSNLSNARRRLPRRLMYDKSLAGLAKSLENQIGELETTIHNNPESNTEKEQTTIETFIDMRLLLSELATCDISQEGFDEHLDNLFRKFEITARVEREVLRYMIYFESVPLVTALGGHLHSDCTYYEIQQCLHPFSWLTGIPAYQIGELFSSSSQLVRKGILSSGNHNSAEQISLNRVFANMAYSRGATEAEIRTRFLGAEGIAKLKESDFGHIADDFKRIRNILKNALLRDEQGVNILLYGSAGTGKTELSKTLCAEAGASFYVLTENSLDTDRTSRLDEYLMGNALLSGVKNSVIVMDEAEDIFYESRHYFNSKLRYTRMLENNKTPAIWIFNDIGSVDKAYIRRFTFALNVKKPGDAEQEKIWREVLESRKMPLGEDRIRKLVNRYDIPPAIIDTAVRSAGLQELDGGIEKTIERLEEAMDGRMNHKRPLDSAVFNPSLLNTDTDLTRLADRVVNGTIRAFSLCLYGAPGTGKSAYARYLAERLGMKVLYKRASDLISCWVGETEKNIARAFSEAIDTNKILVLDEADTFLRSREKAVRSWEVSEVNEMLTWMEDPPLPFICTTNLMDDLDRAALRRFTFKVKYDYLRPEQTAQAFRHFFSMDAPAALSHLAGLTPGDFAVVKNKAGILDATDPGELANMLEMEQSAKGIKNSNMGSTVYSRL
jgi:SpoVK/Ycf46/Vps4 family AAA+-type ATPase